jgi:hypothetical protein
MQKLPTLAEALAMQPGEVSGDLWNEGVLIKRMHDIEEGGDLIASLIASLMPALRAKIEEQTGAERSKTVLVNLGRLCQILSVAE